MTVCTPTHKINDVVQEDRFIDTVGSIIKSLHLDEVDINSAISKLQQFTDLDLNVIQTAYNKVHA